MIMQLSKFRLFLAIGVLLSFSNFCFANSTHNFYIMTLSILSYAKWNTESPVLCVVDNNNTAKQFSASVKSQNSPFIVKSISHDALKVVECDAVFFSNTSAIAEQKLINSSFKTNMLSFSTNNNECEIGSSFCLQNIKNGNTIFKVNLDSLVRSKVHVDPRVLLLAKKSE